MIIKPRWKKILADLWGNKTRTILVVLSIAIGVFAIGMVAQSYLLMEEAVNAGYQVVNPTSAFIMTSDFDQAMVDSIRAMPEVAQAEGRRARQVRANLRDHWYTTQLYAWDYADSQINLLQSMSGAPIPADRQVLIDQTALALTDFAIGDVVTVEMSNGRRYDMTIVGSVRDQNAEPSINSGGINLYTTLDTFEWLGETAKYNRLLYVAADNKSDPVHIKALTGDIKDKMERSGLVVYFTLIFAEPGVSPVKFIIETIRLVLGILASVSLALSAFLVFNTMSALIMRQVKFIGIMKAVGANTPDMVRMYLLLVVAFGLLAFVVAAPPAAFAAYRFAEFVGSPHLTDLNLPPFQVTPQAVLLELFVSVLVPVLAALPAIRRGTRVTVHAALNTQGLAEEDLSGTLLERVIQRLKFVTGPALLSLGNILRDKRRVLLTLGTLILGGAVFIGVMSVSASADQTVAEMGQAYRFDVQVTLERQYRLAAIEQEALAVPGVERIEGWTSANGSIVNADGEEGNSMTVLGLPVDSELTRPKIVNGRWLQPGDTNALVIDTSLLREDPSLAVGDQITLKIAGNEEPWTIVGVYQNIGVRVWYESYASYDYVSHLIGDVGQTRQVQIVTTHHDPAYQAEVAGRIEGHFRDRDIRVTSIETSSDMRNVQKEQFDIIVSVLLMMAMLITLVGGLGLAGTMSMSVIERTREIGVMRAVGASDRSVLRVVLAEGVLMALISWLASVALALPVGKLMSLVIGGEIANGPLSYVYSVPGAVLWLFLVLLVALIASYLPARNASRLTVRDVLAYE